MLAFFKHHIEEQKELFLRNFENAEQREKRRKEEIAADFQDRVESAMLNAVVNSMDSLIEFERAPDEVLWSRPEFSHTDNTVKFPTVFGDHEGTLKYTFLRKSTDLAEHPEEPNTEVTFRTARPLEHMGFGPRLNEDEMDAARQMTQILREDLTTEQDMSLDMH